MASSSKFIIIIFFILLIASSFSIEIQARQFFNKVSSTSTQEEPVLLPRKQHPSPEQQQERDPSFYAQTSESSSYGLYSRDSDSEQLTATTTATASTYKPYVTPVRYHPDEPYNAIPTNNNHNQNLQEAERNTFYNNDEDDENSTTDATYGNNGGKLQQQLQQNNEEESEDVMRSERQGMSDTRFLEKGKYYYDINSKRSNSGADKYPQSGDGDGSHIIYNNNNNDNNGYANLQGRRNTNYNSNLQNQEEFQQFDVDQP